MNSNYTQNKTEKQGSISYFSSPWERSDFLGGSDGKASAYNVGYPGSIPGSGRSPGEGNGSPLCILAWKIPWTEEPGVGYSPWGRKELDTTERLHFHFLSLSGREIWVETNMV